MRWLLLIGGDTCWAGGQIAHRVGIKACQPRELKDVIIQTFEKDIYLIDDDHAPPMPHLDTWVLGFRIQDGQVENRALSIVRRRMERLNASIYENSCAIYEDLYWDPAKETLENVDLLSKQKCMQWMQTVAEHLLDSGEVEEKEIEFYEFSDRPKCFPKPNLAVEDPNWKVATVSMFEKEISNAKRPAAAAGAGAGPSKRDKAIDSHDSSDKLKLNHLTSGVRAALIYAGYSVATADGLIKNQFRTSYHPLGHVPYSWSLKLPSGKRVSAYKHILDNPCPSNEVVAYPICHTLACRKEFGHKGRCSVPRSDASKVKPEFDVALLQSHPPAPSPVPGVPPPPASGVPPQSVRTPRFDLSRVPANQIASGIAGKKRSVAKALAEARYPPGISSKLLERTEFKPVGVNNAGRLVIKFSMRLPNGVSVGNEASILQNPYSLGGAGFFGGELQGPRQKKQRQVEESTSNEISSSGNERENSAAKDSMGLVSTEEVNDGSDMEGEDPSSSLEG